MTEKAIVLAVEDLKKKIRNRWIIKGISFDIRSGEVFGFLGPNGAGKTTTIRMLVGLIRATEGSIRIGGISLKDDPNQALRQIGCIVENPELYPYLSGWENLEHFARMLPDTGQERIKEVVEIVGLDQRIHDKVKTYSLGMRQRLGIAQALLGKPALLILDEPTNGLDPQGIKEIRQFIRRLAGEGLSVLVSSHLLSEIQLMCDRVAIISHGSLIAVGEVSDLIHREKSTVIWHVLPREKSIALLSQWEGVTMLDDEAYQPELAGVGAEWGIVTEVNPAQISEIARSFLTSGIQLYAVSIKNPTLEDLFLRLTEGETID